MPLPSILFEQPYLEDKNPSDSTCHKDKGNLLFLPLVQEHVEPFSFKSLNGVSEPTAKPKLTFGNYASSSFFLMDGLFKISAYNKSHSKDSGR